MRNFGHNGPENFTGIGVNGKNSEFHAAMGILNLKYVDDILNIRKDLSHYYNETLDGFSKSTPNILIGSEYNYAYYPIILPSEHRLLKIMKLLNDNEIYPRRYFYPSLNTLNYLNRQEAPISEDVSRRVLCLPLFHTLSKEEIDFIARLLLSVQCDK